MSSKATGLILLVEDDLVLRDEIKIALAEAGYSVTAVGSVREGSKVFTSNNFDLVVTDLRLPGASGMEMLELAQTQTPPCQVLMVTAHASVETAVEAMRKGAFHYLVKPFPVEALLAEVEKAIQHGRLLRERDVLRACLSKEHGVGQILGVSKAIASLRQMVNDAAQVDSTVLVTGETGTGKELVVDALHYEGPRAAGPLIKVNCAAISETLLESEIFGHEKGAFTGADRQRIGRFERAHGGTLFLDEISEMGAGLQAKLLRILQGAPFERIGGEAPIQADVRIVAATNREPEEAVRQGRLRQDLFYRLNIVRIAVPPLRDRAEDIPILAGHFLQTFAAKFGKRVSGFSDEALRTLSASAWPGNVRELEACIERALVQAQGDRIERVSAPPAAARSGHENPPNPDEPFDLRGQEKQTILKTLEETAWNKSEASRRLGIYPSSLYRKMKRFGISQRSG